MKELPRLGVRQVAFSGGEPLLRPDLEEVMQAGLCAGIENFSIVTNGWFVTPARVRSLQAEGLASVQVSLDGADALDYCEVRGGTTTAFYRALRAVRFFRESGIPVDASAIVSRANVERLEELALLCDAVGARSLRFCAFVPTGRAVSDEIRAQYDLEPAMLDGFFEAMRAMNAHPKARLQVYIDHGIGPWRADGSFECKAGTTVAYLSSEGDLYPCPGLIHEPFKVGNIHETPLAELLVSPAMHAVRNTPKSAIEGPCSTCDNERCSGGCRGAAYAHCGNVLGPVSYCHFAPETGQARLRD
jgi:pyrroloquinoline quinone biosynthesis protein E